MMPCLAFGIFGRLPLWKPRRKESIREAKSIHFMAQKKILCHVQQCRRECSMCLLVKYSLNNTQTWYFKFSRFSKQKQFPAHNSFACSHACRWRCICVPLNHRSYEWNNYRKHAHCERYLKINIVCNERVEYEWSLSESAAVAAMIYPPIWVDWVCVCEREKHKCECAFSAFIIQMLLLVINFSTWTDMDLINVGVWHWFGKGILYRTHHTLVHFQYFKWTTTSTFVLFYAVHTRGACATVKHKNF